jgi:hypothetical protein
MDQMDYFRLHFCKFITFIPASLVATEKLCEREPFQMCGPILVNVTDEKYFLPR